MSWKWATVTKTSPLRIRLDNDTQELPLTPGIAGGGVFVANQRVWRQIEGNQVIVHAPTPPIDDTGWIAPTLLNGWVNYDTGSQWEQAGYRMIGGVVYLRGLVKGGSLQTQIFILPTQYRPRRRLIFASVAGNLFGRIDVIATGEIYWYAGGTNEYVSLSGISYPIG